MVVVRVVKRVQVVLDREAMRQRALLALHSTLDLPDHLAPLERVVLHDPATGAYHVGRVLGIEPWEATDLVYRFEVGMLLPEELAQARITARDA